MQRQAWNSNFEQSLTLQKERCYFQHLEILDRAVDFLWTCGMASIDVKTTLVIGYWVEGILIFFPNPSSTACLRKDACRRIATLQKKQEVALKTDPPRPHFYAPPSRPSAAPTQLQAVRYVDHPIILFAYACSKSLISAIDRHTSSNR